MHASVTPSELNQLLERNSEIKVLDVRRREDRVEVEHPIPGAEWRDPEQLEEWAEGLDPETDLIVYCVHGHHVCKAAREALRERGLRAKILEGGIEAWQAFRRRS